MKLASIASVAGPRASVLIGDDHVLDLAAAERVLPIARWVPPEMRKLIGGGGEGLTIIRQIADAAETASSALRTDLIETGALAPLDSVRLAAPVPDPGILLSHARAYRAHLAEMEKGQQQAPEYPVGFTKNQHAIIGSGTPIRLPASAADMVDFEGEISVVFGCSCHGVTADEALDYVFGVTIVNDVSARDWAGEIKQFPDRNRMGKQFAGFAPMGPWIATRDEIADMNDLRMTTRLNGEVMQDSSTRDLIWSLPALIEYYSRWYPFQPGDVLTTGSPAGVGFGRDPKVFMRPGDTIAVTVDGVGTLTNPIVADGVSSAGRVQN